MKIIAITISMAIMLVFTGASCTQSEITDSEMHTVSDQCISLCEDAINSGQDLSQGPCLADPMETEPDWVCDVAHSPRQDNDDLAENQCLSYRSRDASHFVEVTPECQLINTN